MAGVRLVLRAAVLLGVAFALASCGGSDSGGEGDTTPATTPTSTTSATIPAATTAAGPTTFRDPAGDVTPGAGPDLTAVTVSHTTDEVTFAIRFADAPPLRVSESGGWIDMLLIGIDVPPLGPPPTPTGWTGVDYVAGLHGPQRTVLLRSMGTPSPDVRRLDATVEGPIVRFSVPRRMIGDPGSFAFTVAAAREGEGPSGEGDADFAPAEGAFSYALIG